MGSLLIPSEPNGVSAMVGLRIQLVCAGNVCRSPALEMMLKEGCGGPGWKGMGFEVVSAGTVALVGEPLESRMRRSLIELGFRTDDAFSATQLTPTLVDAAALVLTATTAQRAQVFRVVPHALPKTFTFKEFVARSRTCRTAANTPAERLTAMIAHAARQRGVRLFRRPEDEDITDPYRRSLRTHRRTAIQLLDLATELTRAVA